MQQGLMLLEASLPQFGGRAGALPGARPLQER
jgi:hypothetical protein